MPEVSAVLLGDLNMLRCFDDSDVPVVVAVSDPTDATLASRFSTRQRLIAPFDDEERVLADLERLGRELGGRPVLFYGTDRQLLLLSRHRERLTPWFRFLLPPADIVEATVDKRLFAELARSSDLPVPATVCSRDVSGVDELVARASFPCVLKPNVHIGWFAHVGLHTTGPRKALLANNEAELRALYANVSKFTTDFVVQEYVPGGEEQIHSFHAYVDGAGSVLGEFVGKKIRTFPREAGISTYLELVKEPRVLEMGREVVKALGLVGPLKLDFKMDPVSHRLFLLEVNARFNLWNHLGAVSGINLPAIAFADLTGGAVPVTDGYATDIRWISFGDDLRSFLRSYRPSGDLGWLGWLGSLRGKMIHDSFAWHDPLPWAASMLQYGRALGARLSESSAP